MEQQLQQQLHKQLHTPLPQQLQQRCCVGTAGYMACCLIVVAVLVCAWFGAGQPWTLVRSFVLLLPLSRASKQTACFLRLSCLPPPLLCLCVVFQLRTGAIGSKREYELELELIQARIRS